MRHVKFEVPSEVIGDFTDKMTEMELENTILGKNEDDEIIVRVDYEKDESGKVDDLEDHLKDLVEDLYEDEDEDQEDEEDQN